MESQASPKSIEQPVVGNTTPSTPMGEFAMSTAPGVPLKEASQRTPGVALPENGYLVPSDAPGFGIELTREEIESAAI